MPLHLLLGLRISVTPSATLHRRRTSPGMSLKYRHCSFGFQMGPSVNQKPVQSFSTAASLSISLSISGELTSTALMESFIPFSRLLIVQVHPPSACARALLYTRGHSDRTKLSSGMQILIWEIFQCLRGFIFRGGGTAVFNRY